MVVAPADLQHPVADLCSEFIEWIPPKCTPGQRRIRPRHCGCCLPFLLLVLDRKTNFFLHNDRPGPATEIKHRTRHLVGPSERASFAVCTRVRFEPNNTNTQFFCPTRVVLLKAFLRSGEGRSVKKGGFLLTHSPWSLSPPFLCFEQKETLPCRTYRSHGWEGLGCINTLSVAPLSATTGILVEPARHACLRHLSHRAEYSSTHRLAPSQLTQSAPAAIGRIAGRDQSYPRQRDPDTSQCERPGQSTHQR